MNRLSRVVPVLAVLLASSAACSRKPAPAAAPTPEPQATANDADAERQRREAAEREAARRAEEERIRAEREAAERNRAAARNALTAPVYFEYNRAELSAETRAALDAKIPALRSNPAVRIRVAGHTDARGSDEYNLSLAQRRAAATKRYLTERQIDASRIEVVGFGEERALCSDSGEQCWRQNRRAEFEIVDGDLTVGVSQNR